MGTYGLVPLEDSRSTRLTRIASRAWTGVLAVEVGDVGVGDTINVAVEMPRPGTAIERHAVRVADTGAAGCGDAVLVVTRSNAATHVVEPDAAAEAARARSRGVSGDVVGVAAGIVDLHCTGRAAEVGGAGWRRTLFSGTQAVVGRARRVRRRGAVRADPQSAADPFAATGGLGPPRQITGLEAVAEHQPGGEVQPRML